MAKFNIINKSEELVDYILQITEKSPKKLRCDIVPEIRKISIYILENIIRANETERKNQLRLKLQKQSLTDIKILNAELEICLKHNYIVMHQLETATKLSFDLFEMINNWIESDKKLEI